MRFDDIVKVVGTIPFLPPADGKLLYDFILASGRKHILELGFAHGTSTCYMAAALDEAGRIMGDAQKGEIVTIDNLSADEYIPDIETLLKRTHLASYVTPIHSETSYTWELKRMIEAQTRNHDVQPLFDFCFIDGAHNWETDGLAFFLVEKLLVPGGWILFDDLDWTYAERPSLRDTPMVKAMPHDVKTTPHIDRIFSLLVIPHPSFENFRREGRWGWAQKKSGIPSRSVEALDKVYQDRSIASDAAQLPRKIYHRFV
ncbi:MAG TPA: class I SAM-dependent methyltransferase [Candidatus Kapabacteria bacterium]|nr:class I SAM-dependent methyltransferase [Candidatus Kapabacteria bacterium]